MKTQVGRMEAFDALLESLAGRTPAIDQAPSRPATDTAQQQRQSPRRPQPDPHPAAPPPQRALSLRESTPQSA